jgi:hypothetical protein
VQLDPDHPWPAIDRFRQLAAEFIDDCNRRKNSWVNSETGPEQVRLYELAMTDVENAVMWVVKAEVLGSYGPGKAFRP